MRLVGEAEGVQLLDKGSFQTRQLRFALGNPLLQRLGMRFGVAPLLMQFTVPCSGLFFHLDGGIDRVLQTAFLGIRVALTKLLFALCGTLGLLLLQRCQMFTTLCECVVAGFYDGVQAAYFTGQFGNPCVDLQLAGHLRLPGLEPCFEPFQQRSDGLVGNLLDAQGQQAGGNGFSAGAEVVL